MRAYFAPLWKFSQQTLTSARQKKNAAFWYYSVKSHCWVTTEDSMKNDSWQLLFTVSHDKSNLGNRLSMQSFPLSLEANAHVQEASCMSHFLTVTWPKITVKVTWFPNGTWPQTFLLKEMPQWIFITCCKINVSIRSNDFFCQVCLFDPNETGLEQE